MQEGSRKRRINKSSILLTTSFLRPGSIISREAFSGVSSRLIPPAF